MTETIPTTTPAELKEAIEGGERLTVVDVRQPGEFDCDHIRAPNVETAWRAGGASRDSPLSRPDGWNGPLRGPAAVRR